MDILLLIAIGGGIIFLLVKYSKRSSKTSVTSHVFDSEDGQPSKWKYTHTYKDWAIGVNPTDGIVRLSSTFNKIRHQKDYHFSDVRSWKFNLASGGMIVGGSATRALGHNLMQNRLNEAETGLFIQVRDIDFPEWRIAFKPNNSRELELKRWMEILQQEINQT